MYVGGAVKGGSKFKIIVATYIPVRVTKSSEEEPIPHFQVTEQGSNLVPSISAILLTVTSQSGQNNVLKPVHFGQ